MKKNWLLIIILLNSLVAQANDPDSTNRKWELGIFYSPSTINEFKDFFSQEANYLLGFSAQANIYLKDKISMETGINYKHKRIEKVKIIIYGLNSGSGDDFNDIKKTNIIEIPINFKFYLQKKSKLSFSFICGITNSIYFEKIISKDYSVVGNPNTRNRKYYNLIVNLGVGGQYDINNKIGILFEPSIGYFAIGVLQEYGVIELKTGIVYHF